MIDHDLPPGWLRAYDSRHPTVRCSACVDGGAPGSAHSSPPDPCPTCGGWQRVPFVERTDDFRAALAALDALRAEQVAHHEGVLREAAACVRRAVEAAPKGRKKRPPAPEEAAARDVSSHYLDTCTWAREAIGLAACNAAEAHLLKPHEEEQSRFSERIEAKKAEVASLALSAVFPLAAEKTKVYEPPYGAYSSQGWGKNGYLEAYCMIRVAILQARGFTATVEHTDRPRHHGSGTVREFRVEANAPPEVAHALRYWRLDDQRLILATNPANLKVLFGGMFPYAGAWDWPEAKRERRDHASFDAHRANEDAHLNLNGGRTAPRYGAGAPVSYTTREGRTRLATVEEVYVKSRWSSDQTRAQAFGDGEYAYRLRFEEGEGPGHPVTIAEARLSPAPASCPRLGAPCPHPADCAPACRYRRTA